MKRVAILGGGPAGAFAAEQLASRGIAVSLFDEKLAWEKPCGGGLTHKAYSRYPFLADNPTPKRFIHETVLGAPKAGTVTLKLPDPILIYSRLDLNRLILERAEKAGARLEKARVTGLERHENHWRIRTTAGIAEADFCIVATGARNPLRDVATQLTASDSLSAMGYYVPGDQERIEVEFLAGLEGYIWVFPRCGHLSVGIAGKREPASALRKRLENFMDARGISYQGARFYSHLLPSLEAESWRKNRVAGEGWIAVGDAAGLVDPITGEGLYYAVRSGDLAAQAVLADDGSPETSYRKSLYEDFAEDLTYGAHLSHRFYMGKFWLGSIPTRMVQFTRRSPRFTEVMQDLFAGRQPYRQLKDRLLGNLNPSVLEIIRSFGGGGMQESGNV